MYTNNRVKTVRNQFENGKINQPQNCNTVLRKDLLKHQVIGINTRLSQSLESV